MGTWRVLLPVSLLTLVACRGPGPDDTAPMVGRPTPAPSAFLTNPRDPAQRDSALAYGSRLIFAEDGSHRYHGNFDRNLLDTLGTVGTVAPEVGMHRMRPADLQRGRIQLRVRIAPRPGYLAGYAPGTYGRLPPDSTYRFPPGESYVWVDSLRLYSPYRADTAGTAKIVVIPVDRSFAVDTATVLVFRRDVANQAISRWSPAACWDCMRSSWCALR